MTRKFVSEVWILWWKYHSSEQFEFSNLEHAMMSEDLVLKSLKPFWRKFARVVWVEKRTGVVIHGW